MQRDRFIEETPFFTEEHARLATSVANFAADEIEPHAHREEEAAADENYRSLVALRSQTSPSSCRAWARTPSRSRRPSTSATSGLSARATAAPSPPSR